MGVVKLVEHDGSSSVVLKRCGKDSASSSVKEIKLKKDGHFLFRVLFKPPESRTRHGYPLEIRGLVSPDGQVKISSAEVMLFNVHELKPEVDRKNFSCKIRK